MTTKNWVWIRGLARHSLHWYDFESHFRKKFPNDAVEMMDVRGNGTEVHVPSFLTMAENVRDLRARSHLAHQGPVHLLTLSLGSMIGIEWAKLFPKEIASLTCINTSDARSAPVYERLRPRNLKTILHSAFIETDAYQTEMNNLNMIAQNLKNKEEVAAEFAKYPPTSLLNLGRQLVAASQFRAPSHKLEVPVLILGSRGDIFVNPKCTEKMAEAMQVPVVWHPSAGHDLPLEEPEWVVEQLFEFLKPSA